MTLHFHPGSDANHRLPHIQSRYRVELGAELGLSGADTAKLDAHIEGAIPAAQLRSFAQQFRARFSTEDLIQAVVADVNQQDPEAERYILPKTLFKWAQPENKEGNRGFDSYSIFFNDEEAGEFGSRKCLHRTFFLFFLPPFFLIPNPNLLTSHRHVRRRADGGEPIYPGVCPARRGR